MAGLAVVGVPILTEMGLAVALTVAIAVVLAITLLPALLGFAGRRIAAARLPEPGSRDPKAGGDAGRLCGRWVRLVTRRPVTVLLVAVTGLAVLSVPAAGLRLGLPDEGTYPPGSTQRKAYDLTAEGFGPGIQRPPARRR